MIRFGPFQIDSRTWLLTCENRAVDLSPRLVEILGFIDERADNERLPAFLHLVLKALIDALALGLRLPACQDALTAGR